MWDLLSRPGLWSQWSPYVAGAEGLGSPQVESGRAGHVVLRGGLRVSALITEVKPGESWTWKVGGILLRHTVTAKPAGGSRIEHELEGSSRPWSVAAFAYLPVVAAIARSLVRVAERSE